jgi:formimidoylglutamate deiminase
MTDHQALFSRHALLPDGWHDNVLLRWDTTGRLQNICTDTVCPADAERHDGALLPGMPNLHSHAFQRAFSGLTEYRAAADDDFWSWRNSMYSFANRIRPEQLEAIATYLYIEMLQAGYTSVCEFHYLHQNLDGQAYADDAELSLALIRAAERAGIGLTLLPVLYQQSGFAGLPPGHAQRRFIRSTDSLLKMIEHLRPLCQAQGGQIGLAPHSLRAVVPQALSEAIHAMRQQDARAPIHIHIAEQQKEVRDCLAWSGMRPVEWLLQHHAPDAGWCLVHATHLNNSELETLARSGAVAGLCPTTEANLGDGIFPASTWLQAGGYWGIGSDSHVSVSVADELRLLEYGQRLSHQQRNVLNQQDLAQTGRYLYSAAVSGGARASARPIAGLQVGQQADFVLLDATQPLLAGMDAEAQLASYLFALSATQAIDSVWTAGLCRVRAGRHPLAGEAGLAFSRARQQCLAH